jgi:hypothetical protein
MSFSLSLSFSDVIDILFFSFIQENMPIEESANMLLMVAAVALATGTAHLVSKEGDVFFLSNYIQFNSIQFNSI